MRVGSPGSQVERHLLPRTVLEDAETVEREEEKLPTPTKVWAGLGWPGAGTRRGEHRAGHSRASRPSTGVTLMVIEVSLGTQRQYSTEGIYFACG